MNDSSLNPMGDVTDERRGDTSPPPNTLKHRIKRAMAMECDDSSSVHISSVLAAASALASLGDSTPPSTPENSAASVNHITFEHFAPTANPRAMPPKFDHDVPMTFPQKLMEILSNSQISDIITWLPNGKGFIILQKRKFASQVMPLYFKHSKFTSFTRKLNRWGFVRVTKGPESGAYYHKYFQRGEHSLCMQMHCQSSKTLSRDTVPRENESPAVSCLTSPGVASAMSSLHLEESPSPTAPLGPMTKRPPFETSFSTSNPKIFAPDLSRRDVMDISSDDNGDSGTGSQGSLCGIKPSFTLNYQQKHLLNEQAFSTLHACRQQLTKNQHGVNPSALQHAHQDRSQPTRPFSYEKVLGSLNTASSRQHPFVIQAAMNALLRTDSASQSQMSNQSYLRMLEANKQSKFLTCPANVTRPVMEDQAYLSDMLRSKEHNKSLGRSENVTRAPMNDQAYLEMLRAKEQTKASALFVSALGAALGNPADTQTIINRAIQAQVRKYEGHHRRVDDCDMKPIAPKANCHMSQGQVAHLRQELAQNGMEAGVKDPMDRYRKAVRRASAA